MVFRRRGTHSDLFMLRVWPEEVNDGDVEWRGRVQHVISGETRYFHNWEVMLTFLIETLDSSVPERKSKEEK